MTHTYICDGCIFSQIGRHLNELTVPEHAHISKTFGFNVQHDIDDRTPILCPICGHPAVKVFAVATTYVVGYGLLDKKNVTQDMNLHAMVTNRDPYSEHRKPGETRDVIDRLRKSKEFDPKPESVNL